MDGEFEKALRRTRNPVLVADDERRYIGANDAALRLFGLTLEALLDTRIDDYFVPQDGERLEDVWADFLKRGGVTGWGCFRVAGGQEVLRYGAVANVAPGRHVSIFLIDAEDGEAAAEPSRVLTAREREVVALAAHGNTTRQIAERLVVSPTTVDTHIRSAMERLGARNRVHAVALALARGEVVFPTDD